MFKLNSVYISLYTFCQIMMTSIHQNSTLGLTPRFFCFSMLNKHMWGWTVEDCDSLKPARSFLYVCPTFTTNPVALLLIQHWLIPRKLPWKTSLHFWHQGDLQSLNLRVSGLKGLVLDVWMVWCLEGWCAGWRLAWLATCFEHAFAWKRLQIYLIYFPICIFPM